MYRLMSSDSKGLHVAVASCSMANGTCTEIVAGAFGGANGIAISLISGPYGVLRLDSCLRYRCCVVRLCASGIPCRLIPSMTPARPRWLTYGPRLKHSKRLRLAAWSPDDPDDGVHLVADFDIDCGGVKNAITCVMH